MEWAAIGVNLVMAGLSAVSAVGYGLAFKDSGPVSLSVGYALRIGLHPWFLVALATALGAAMARPVLFSMLGVTRAYMVGPVAFVAIMLASVLVFKERIEPMHWIGAAVIFAGTLLVVK